MREDEANSFTPILSIKSKYCLSAERIEYVSHYWGSVDQHSDSSPTVCVNLTCGIFFWKKKNKMWVTDKDTNLWASNGPGGLVPAASVRCAACSPSRSLSSRWSPPAEETPSCRSAKSWTQKPDGIAPPRLRERERGGEGMEGEKE